MDSKCSKEEHFGRHPYYHRDYTRDEIETILEKIKNCISAGQYTISMNAKRQENITFIRDYNIRSNDQKEMLLNIQVNDFCHTLNNTNKGFEHEILYVFVPQVQLHNVDGEAERVDVYTKFNLIENSKGNKTVVVSFHKLNKPVEYRFR